MVALFKGGHCSAPGVDWEEGVLGYQSTEPLK